VEDTPGGGELGGGGGPQNPSRLSDTDVNTLGTNLGKVLADSECGKFINAMLKSLPDAAARTTKYNGSLADVFNRIKNGGGFMSGDTGPVAAAKTDPNTLTTTFNNQRSTPAISGQGWQQLGVTLILVHELTHVFTSAPNAGVYGHSEMANAATIAANNIGLDLKSALIQFPNDKNDSIALANYYDRVLGYACRKVKL
jgi:hypothetical protein